MGERVTVPGGHRSTTTNRRPQDGARRGERHEGPERGESGAPPGNMEPVWAREMSVARESAAARAGDRDKRAASMVAAAGDLMGKIEWAAEYPGFGLTGCVSLPFIAAAKAGLISMAQAKRLSGATGEYPGDPMTVIADAVTFVPWPQAPPSRRWGDKAVPKPGDIAVFCSKTVSDRFFDHVAICIDGSGAIFSLEPAPGNSGPNPMVRTTIDEYLKRSDDPEHGCVICPFPF